MRRPSGPAASAIQTPFQPPPHRPPPHPTAPQGGAPDVVYAYTPPADVAVDISTCGSLFDTKIFLFDDPSNLQVGAAWRGWLADCKLGCLLPR